jgi:hypothetical protein
MSIFKLRSSFVTENGKEKFLSSFDEAGRVIFEADKTFFTKSFINCSLDI